MALMHALLRFKNEGRIQSFEIFDHKRAVVQLVSGKSIVVYMSEDYIVGEAEVREAAMEPRAQFVIYNNWDNVGVAAFREAKRLGIEVHKFGAFAFRLDELNVLP